MIEKNIIDPLSTIIKLSILSIKQIGHKITIKNNKLKVYDSTKLVFSKYFVDNIKELQYLSIPIEIACKKYLIENNMQILTSLKSNYSEVLNINIIFKQAIKGLYNLIETYNQNISIVQTLKYCCLIIDNYLKQIELDTSRLSTRYKKPNLSYEFVQMCSNEKEYTDIKYISDISKTKQNKNHIYARYGATGYFYLDTLDNDEINTLDDDKIKIDKLKNIENSIKISLLPKTPDEIKYESNYCNEILELFYNIWNTNKLHYIKNTLDFLLNESDPSKYIECLEIFMISIDKNIIDIIQKNNLQNIIDM